MGLCIFLMKLYLFECGKLCFVGNGVVNTDEIKINGRKWRKKTSKRSNTKMQVKGSHMWWLMPVISSWEAEAGEIAQT